MDTSYEYTIRGVVILLWGGSVLVTYALTALFGHLYYKEINRPQGAREGVTAGWVVGVFILFILATVAWCFLLSTLWHLED
jgi:hypothetical protein